MLEVFAIVEHAAPTLIAFATHMSPIGYHPLADLERRLSTIADAAANRLAECDDDAGPLVPGRVREAHPAAAWTRGKVGA
jgi:hypothetical protein